MPARRRQAKRRALAGADGELFLFSDGVKPFLAGDPVYESVFVARAAWRECRAATWSHPARSLWPPVGAVVYDKVTARTAGVSPTGMGRAWSVDAVRVAVGEDLASVVRFRLADRAGAAEVTEELEGYCSGLRVLLGALESAGETRNEGGYPAAAAEAWAEVLRAHG